MRAKVLDLTFFTTNGCIDTKNSILFLQSSSKSTSCSCVAVHNEQCHFLGAELPTSGSGGDTWLLSCTVCRLDIRWVTLKLPLFSPSRDALVSSIMIAEFLRLIEARMFMTETIAMLWRTVGSLLRSCKKRWKRKLKCILVCALRRAISLFEPTRCPISWRRAVPWEKRGRRRRDPLRGAWRLRPRYPCQDLKSDKRILKTISLWSSEYPQNDTKHNPCRKNIDSCWIHTTLGYLHLDQGFTCTLVLLHLHISERPPWQSLIYALQTI